MSNFDLDRLGDVWRQQPDPAEVERLQKSAAAVARRARLTQVLDIGAAVAVSAAVIVFVASNPRLDTVLIGAAAILVLLFSNIRLRRVRRAELKTLTGSTEDMLDQSIDRVETTLRYRRFTLVGFGPALIVGALVSAQSQRRGFFSLFQGLSPTYHDGLLLAGGLILIGALIAAWRGLRRGSEELDRLRAMREAYRREHESTAP
jgi:hypothetical protein